MKKETTAVKTYINGQLVIIPSNQADYDDINKIGNGEEVYIIIRTIPDTKHRSVEQNNLYWKSCTVLAANSNDKNFDTKEKVDHQTKIHLRHVEYWYYYKNERTGEETLNLKPKSIAFENMDHWEAIGFFDGAFKYHAEIVGMDVDSWIDNVKSQMGGE